MAPYSPFNSARLQAMALAQAGPGGAAGGGNIPLGPPAPVRPPAGPPRMPAQKPYVAPVTASTSQYDQEKAVYDQQVAAALAQHQAQLAAADRSGVPYQNLATSAQSLPDQITAGYDAAANRSEAFTNAYSQAFRDHSTKLQQEQQALMDTQNPNGGVVESRGSGLGDALAFMGSLPARGYRDSGTGLAEAARFLPISVAGRGLDAVATAKASENTAYAKLLSDLGVSGAKSLLDASQQDRTFGLDSSKFSYQQWKDTQAATADKSKEAYTRWKDGQTLGVQRDQINAAHERAGEITAKVDPAVSKILGYVAHADGTPAPGLDGKPIPLKANATSGGRIDLALSRNLGYYAHSDASPAVGKDGKAIPFRDTAGTKIDPLPVSSVV